jgi:cbb3-type cytochrome oxidase maturation protein
MSALIVLVIVSIAVAGLFLGAFIWSVNSDQYDDKEGAAMRILFDDNKTTSQNNTGNIL